MKSKNFLIKSLLLTALVLSFVALKPSFAALDNYTFTTAVTDGFLAGQDEYWHLVPAKIKSEFYLGEKVHFFAQSDFINVPHTWAIKIYSGDKLVDEVSTYYNPGDYGWKYSNFDPWVDDLTAGSYEARFYINIGNGEEYINSKYFTVSSEVVDGRPLYVFAHAYTASSWEHGQDNEYWDLKPIGQRKKFNVGENVQLMTQVRNIYVTHRYKVELQKDGVSQWDYTSDWLNVGQKWEYGNFYPVYYDAHPGNYTFVVSIDVGDGFTNLATVPFSVEGELKHYSYAHTYLATGWTFGGGETDDNYWDLRPVGQNNVFKKGDTIYALSQIKEIYYGHQWKVEFYRGEEKLWEYEDPWRDVGSGWAFGNFYPAYYNAQPGEYSFKIYLNTGNGYELLDTKEFSVTGEYDEVAFNHAVTATSWEHGSEGEYWNLKPIDERDHFELGENIYLMSQVRNIHVDHRYRAELYSNGELMWGFNTGWQKVGAGWDYSNFFPVYHNAKEGNYEFRYYLDTGDGFKYYGSKGFTVGDTSAYLDYNRGVTVYNTVSRKDFEYFREIGVSTVRLMLMDGDLLMPGADYDIASSDSQILPENIDKLNTVLDLGEEYGIKVIVDLHEVPGMNRWFISEEKPKDTRMWETNDMGQMYRDLVVDIWGQLSDVMKDRNMDGVVYELFNEPEPKTDFDPNENKAFLWESLQDKLIDTIRGNEDNHLIIATPAYSWRTEALADWTPSETVLNDENVIVSVHGYRPIQFTIQEEAWYGNKEYNQYPGIIDEEHYGETLWNHDQINKLFTDVVDNFYNKYNKEVYIAEFAVNREAPGADLWLLDMMNVMNKEHPDEIWGWSVHVWDEAQYARLNHLEYDWSRQGMNDFTVDSSQLEAVIAGLNNEEEMLMN